MVSEIFESWKNKSSTVGSQFGIIMDQKWLVLKHFCGKSLPNSSILPKSDHSGNALENFENVIFCEIYKFLFWSKSGSKIMFRGSRISDFLAIKNTLLMQNACFSKIWILKSGCWGLARARNYHDFSEKCKTQLFVKSGWWSFEKRWFFGLEAV